MSRVRRCSRDEVHPRIPLRTAPLHYPDKSCKSLCVRMPDGVCRAGSATRGRLHRDLRAFHPDQYAGSLVRCRRERRTSRNIILFWDNVNPFVNWSRAGLEDALWITWRENLRMLHYGSCCGNYGGKLGFASNNWPHCWGSRSPMSASTRRESDDWMCWSYGEYVQPAECRSRAS